MKILFLILLTSCAYVHHVQLSDIEQKTDHILVPIEIMVSETGVDLGEAADLAASMSQNKQTSDSFSTIRDIINMIQMGPRTGNPVFSETYADKLATQIYEKCPSGQLTGLMSIREMNKYPVVSGEIVRVKGYCLKRKTEAKSKKEKA